jgi:hypothetical protein
MNRYTEQQLIKFAYEDLKGAMEDPDAHDWAEHAGTIKELEKAFPFLIEDEQ